MIFGIGTDLLNVNRFDKVKNKFKDKFIYRIFGSNEINLYSKKKNIASSLFLAKRFAAKEALWKALNPKRGQGLSFSEMEILNFKNGNPYFFFSGNVENYIKKLEKNHKSNLNFNISLTDEPPYVMAFVIISLAPKL